MIRETAHAETGNRNGLDSTNGSTFVPPPMQTGRQALVNVATIGPSIDKWGPLLFLDFYVLLLDGG